MRIAPPAVNHRRVAASFTCSIRRSIKTAARCCSYWRHARSTLDVDWKTWANFRQTHVRKIVVIPVCVADIVTLVAQYEKIACKRFAIYLKWSLNVVRIQEWRCSTGETISVPSHVGRPIVSRRLNALIQLDRLMLDSVISTQYNSASDRPADEAERLQ